MPTLTRTWTSSQNNSCASNDSQLDQVTEIALDIKTKLVAAGWTVTQSSDGATTDTSDLWVDTGDIIRGTGAHSWIVLKSPTNWPTAGKSIWFGIDYDTTQDYWMGFASRGDADWTGLTTSAGPNNVATGINSFLPNYQIVVPSSLTACKFHSHYSDQGDFIYYVSNSTSQQAQYGLIINKCTDHDAADLYPVVNFSRGTGSVTAGVSNSGFYYTHMQNVYFTKTFHYSTGVGSGSWPSGSTVDWPTNPSFWPGLASGVAGNDINGKINLMPMYVSTQSPTGSTGLRGHLTDVYTCHGSAVPLASVGDVSPGTGTIEFGCIGGLFVPCTVAPDFS